VARVDGEAADVSWLIIAIVIPIVVAWREGSSYLFAFSLSGVGLLAYFANTALIGYFISRRAPATLQNDTWEQTAGKGIVPKWVSVVGLVGMAFIPSGLVVAALLFFGVVANRS